MAGKKNGNVEKLVDFDKMMAIVRKNWMVLRSDRARLIPMMMFPIVMIVIFGYTAGAVPKHVQAGIVDNDNSQMSQLVLNALYSNQLFNIETHVSSQDEGKRLIDGGAIKILFIIPPGFQQDIMSGKTATISAIVDESDPTVAQITKASTQAIVGQISSQIAAQRVAALSAESAALGATLGKASGTLSSATGDGTEQPLATMASTYRDSEAMSSMADDTLSSTILNLQNTLGYVIDQNEIVQSFNPSTSDGSATIAALAAGDAQQAALTQIAAYQGLQALNGRLAMDSGIIYGNAQKVAADNAMRKATVQVSYSIVNSAQGQAAQLQSDAQTAAQTPLSLNFIEPYGSGRKGIDFLLPSILALIIFQGATMGLGRAIAGERRDGSLTRVFLTPTSNVTIIIGTQLFYLIFETIRSSFIIFTAMILFGVAIKGSVLAVLFIIGLFALGATGVGMVLSVLTRSQEQYIALAGLISLPTIFLAGVFLPIQTMPPVFQGIAKLLPLTYAADALRAVMIKGFGLEAVIPDLLFLVGFGLVMVTLSLLMFKREIV